MNKKNIVVTVFLGLIASSFLFQGQSPAFVSAHPVNFTVPTRTPTPPPPPTATPADNGGGNGSEPPPTAVSQEPANTPTAVILAPTPVGGFLPTAVACSTAPTLTSLSQTNVRSGPGTSYDIMGELVFLETRLISGRAADVAWWQIKLADGRLGWVSNPIIETQGNINVVPIVAAPPINGVEPTPGSGWLPIPPAGCDRLPTWTPDASLASNDSASSNTAPATEVPQPTETPLPETNTEVAAAEADVSNQEVPTPPQLVINEPTAVTVISAAQDPVATVSPPTSPANILSRSSIILLIVVAGLSFLGGIYALYRSRQSS